MEPYYVTTPIYYVNSTPHIGHAYTTVAADVFARHQRQRGRDTFLLTGVDEHASKVARVAEEQGLAPQEYADRIVEALDAFGVTNLAAAPTVYRMLREAGVTAGRRFAPQKLSFTGEPMDARTWDFVEQTFGVEPCSMYGTTEVGVILVNYPGFAGFRVRRGALGKTAPGWEVAVVDDDGPLPPGRVGEIAVRRRGEWFRVKDRGHADADGYVFHAGRSDDVIISAGWTMSALEIEQALLAHPDVREAAVVGVADALRGQIPKACIVAPGKTAAFVRELQEFVKERLSKHEYPRAIELVDELPKTPAGKIDRKTLRDRVT